MRRRKQEEETALELKPPVFNIGKNLRALCVRHLACVYMHNNTIAGLPLDRDGQS